MISIRKPQEFQKLSEITQDCIARPIIQSLKATEVDRCYLRLLGKKQGMEAVCRLKSGSEHARVVHGSPAGTFDGPEAAFSAIGMAMYEAIAMAKETQQAT